MARFLYGGTSADYALAPGGLLVPDARFTVWTARMGGTQITDLTTDAGAATSVVTASATGLIAYYGPDADKAPHWLQPLDGGERTAVVPLDNVGEKGDKGDTGATGVGGGDALITTGEAADSVGWPNGITVEFRESVQTAALGRTIYQTLIDDAVAREAFDDFGPIAIKEGGITIYRAGGHGILAWSASTTLTGSDVGKVWESGANRVTLLKVSDGTAYWSMVHNAALTTLTYTAPTGAYTCSGSPSVTFSSPTSVQLYDWDVTSQTTRSWSGRPQLACLIYSQRIASTFDVIAATQTLGRQALPAECPETLTYVSVWTVRADQPGNIFIDVSARLAKAFTPAVFSGLQAAGWGQNAVVGMAAGHPLVSWAAPGYTAWNEPDWADGEPPTAFMSRRTVAPYGGMMIAILDTGADLANGYYAGNTAATNKGYLFGYGPAAGEQAAGSVMWCSGVRSTTAEGSDRHMHFATGPDGVTRWWLMAGSTGMAGAGHPMLMYLLGKTLTQTRGTATVETVVTAAGVNVSAAGWAEGTLS